MIDEDEGKWLVEKIGADGQVDGVEQQLLDHLKQNAKKMPTSVRVMLNSFGNSNLNIHVGNNVTNDKGSGGNKKWIAIIVALLVAGGVAYYYCFEKNSKIEDVQSAQIEQTESIVPSDSGTDTLQKENVLTKESDSSAGQTVYKEKEYITDAGKKTPVPSGQNTTDDNKVRKKELSHSSNQGRTNANTSADNSISISDNSSKSSEMGSIEQKAHDVWKGVYGNNPERRRNLGNDYEVVQKRVNEMHRQGLY